MKRTNRILVICLLAACLCSTGLGHGVLLLVSFGFLVCAAVGLRAVIASFLSAVVLGTRALLFGRNLFWNDKCDCAFVEGVVVRIFQFKKHLVRTGGKDPLIG
jgi:hypothetical protein